MLNGATETQSLTTFRSHPDGLLTELQRTGRAVMLTVKGVPAAVLQSAEAYQRLLDIAAHADEQEGLRQGLDDEAAGRVRLAREAFDTMRQHYGIPR